MVCPCFKLLLRDRVTAAAIYPPEIILAVSEAWKWDSVAEFPLLFDLKYWKRTPMSQKSLSCPDNKLIQPWASLDLGLLERRVSRHCLAATCNLVTLLLVNTYTSQSLILRSILQSEFNNGAYHPALHAEFSGWWSKTAPQRLTPLSTIDWFYDRQYSF